MDNLLTHLADVESLLGLQIEGMDDFQDTQLAAKKALEEKDWLGLEKALQALEFKSEGLRCVEERRDFCWKKIEELVLHREGNFYEVLPHLPAERREKVSELYRDLKIRSLRLKGLTLGLSAYIQTATSLIKAVVHEINPNLRGRLYSKNGFLRAGEAHPLVMNAHY